MPVKGALGGSIQTAVTNCSKRKNGRYLQPLIAKSIADGESP